MVNRQVWTTGRFARWAVVVVRRIAHARLIGAVAGNSRPVGPAAVYFEPVLLEHRQCRLRGFAEHFGHAGLDTRARRDGRGRYRWRRP